MNYFEWIVFGGPVEKGYTSATTLKAAKRAAKYAAKKTGVVQIRNNGWLVYHAVCMGNAWHTLN